MLNRSVPSNATDCHMHVFGDPAQYPLAAFRSYSVRPAEFAAYRAVHERTGLQRAVLVQASGYHTDNRCMLDTLAANPATCRGIAVIDDTITDAELHRMDRLGVRGIRANLVSVGTLTPRKAWDELAGTTSRIAPFGWHLQLFATPAQLAELGPRLGELPTPIVIDHMGLPALAAGVAQSSFQVLLRLVSEGRGWAKLSGADRITRDQPDMTGAGPFVQALVSANPDNLVWGSDWPHIGWHSSAVHATDEILPYRIVDEALLLRLLADWIPEEHLRTKVLADNPARLYRF
jgi:predicted TIM-barrel fold metal-dependent hydrolase